METVFEAHVSQNYKASNHLAASWHKKSSLYERKSDAKMADREAICNFFLGYFKPKNQIRLLSLPGQYWYFEHMMHNRHDNMFVFAVEKAREIMERNKASILGSHVFCRSHDVNFGDARMGYLKTPCAYWFHGSLSTFTSMMLDGYGASMKQRNGWNSQFCQNNAAWLDFTSPICDEVKKVFNTLHFVMAPNGKPKPVAVTLMYGRDTDEAARGGIMARRKYLEDNIAGFNSKEAHVYEGMNGCRMITIIGEMK